MSSWEESRRRVGEQFEEQERLRRLGEKYKHENDWMKSNTSSNRSTSNSSSYSYSSGGGSSIPTSRLIIIFGTILLVVAAIIITINYHNHNSEWKNATVDKQSSRSVEQYQNYLLSLDNEYKCWNVVYEKAPANFWNYLLSFVNLDKAKGYSFSGYNVEGGNVYDFRFEGDDAKTGIPDGWYTLTKMDGMNVLIDEDNEIIYKKGTEFYDTYASKLNKLVHDNVLSSILEKTSGGDHAMSGSNDSWMEFIRKDNTMVYSYMQSSDETKISGDEFRAIITYPNEKLEERWYFSYSDSEYVPDDWDGFIYSNDASFNGNDELGKLMQKSFDDNGSVVFYKNDKEVLAISIDYFPNGYDFEIICATEDDERGFEEGMVYHINTTDKTLTKYSVDEDEDLVNGTNMLLSSHQDQYDFLLSIVPHTYIRSLIDMDKAETRREKIGLVKIFEMKDKNNKVIADMKLMFGIIGEVNHYIAEDEYVKIELEY